MKYLFLIRIALFVSIAYTSLTDAKAQDTDGDGLLDSLEFGFVVVDGEEVQSSQVPQPTIECDGNVYQVYENPSKIARVDFVNSTFQNIGNTSHGQGLNAAGYNPADGYIYAINRHSPLRDVVRIGGDGSVGSIGEIEGLPKYNYVSGTFGPDDLFYVSDYGWLYGINVQTKKVDYAKPLKTNPSGAEIDLAYDKVRDIFYATSSRGSLSRINHHTGEVDIIGNLGSVFGALVIDSFGNLYGIDNKGTGLYRFNVNDASKTRIADAPGASSNDAAMCSNIHLFVDTDGDGIDDEYDSDADGDQLDNITDSGGFDPTGDNDGDRIPNWSDTSDSGYPGDGSETDYTDSNLDGVPDVFDSDLDGVPNHKDTDSDNDSISDNIESTEDSDADGVPDFLDEDSDNDGLLDSEEGAVDTDGDGTPDFRDEDDDNDGILTIDDDCPRCNFEDNVISYNYRDFDTMDTWGVPYEYFRLTRELWNYLKYELHCVDEGVELEEDKRGFDEGEYEVTVDSEVRVTAIFDGAQFLNSLYWYDARDTNLQLNTVWESYAFGPLAPLMPGSSRNLGIIPAGTKLRFALKSDGANGGREMIYQESFRNLDGRELFASNLDIPREFFADEEFLIASFEDRVDGGDMDFNDVIFKISITPSVNPDGGRISTQFDDVLGEQKGIHSNRGSRGVMRRLQSYGLLDREFETTAELFQMPEVSTEYYLAMIDDRSPMKFSLGLVDWDLLKSADPQSLAFRQLIARHTKIIMDDREVDVMGRVLFNPEELGLLGKQVAMVIIPNNTLEKFASNTHRYTAKGEGNNTKRQCLLSASKGNPEYMDQFLVFSNDDMSMILIEDKARVRESEEAGEASDDSFDDIQLVITPALIPLEPDTTYGHADPDVTEGFIGPDGSGGNFFGDF